jgi:hypothetical protein
MDDILRNVIIIGITIITVSIAVMTLSTILIPQTEFDACYSKCMHTVLSENPLACVGICGDKSSK